MLVLNGFFIRLLFNFDFNFKKKDYMPWYALYTQPRQEKKVVTRLEQLAIEVYCPLLIQVRQWSDRKKKVEVPLLPSYVFVMIAPHERDKVFQVSGVVRYLYWLGQPAIIRDEEIVIMQKWLQNTVTSFEVTGHQKTQIRLKHAPWHFTLN